MRRITYLAALALGLGVPLSAVAQQGGFSGGGSSFGGGGFGGGSSFGGGGSSFGGGGSSFSGGAGFSGGNTFTGGGGTTFSGGGNTFTGGQGFSGGTSFTGGGTGPGRTGVGGSRSATGGFSISPTNFLAATYGNPLYSGRPGSTNLSPRIAGGFGLPSFGSVTSTTVTQTSGALAGGRAGRTGMGTGMGIGTGTARTGGGFSVGVSGGNQSPITYATQVRFDPPPVVTFRLQTDLQALLSRTSAIRQPTSVSVVVDGNTVILRGRVADEDERRLIEGMVRLEPGVREVRNELELR